MNATPSPNLVGRQRECAELDDLLSRLRSGGSVVCAIRGEAGIGKSVLLDYLAERASGTTISRVQGIEADMELAWASLHQLCGPFLGEIDRLPGPQLDALRVAFGMASGDPPGRFLVGLAVLTLLTRASETRPVLVLIDDAQWLDRVSLQTLEFVARRLLAESVAFVFAVRDPEGAALLGGLPALRLEGLDRRPAGALLESVVEGRLEPRVRDRLVAETRGNPLALLELTRGRRAVELAYGPDASGSGSVSSRVEDDFARRLRSLPEHTRTLLLIAAAEPAGDAQLLVRAAERLGVTPDPVPAAAAGLIQLAEPFQFRHPLARSAVYREAGLAQRRAVHRALAEATDPDHEPDRRAWHAAHAASAPDEEVAAALEAAAGRARQRGGVVAEGTLLQRAAELTPDQADRGRRALAAAEAYYSAAVPERATELATIADLCPLSPLDQARLDRLRAQILFALSRSDEAAPLLLDAAGQFEAQGSPLARETYLEAISATVFAGRVQGPYGALAAATAALAATAPPSTSAASDLLLDGVATLLTGDRARGVPMLREALTALVDEELVSRDAIMRWLFQASIAQETFAHQLWDFHAWEVVSARAVRLSREIGALSTLPLALMFAAGVDFHRGDVAKAVGRVEEGFAISAATGHAPLTYASLVVTAWQGDEAATLAVLEQARRSATEHGEVSLLGVSGYVKGVLYNGLGRFDLALAGAREGVDHDGFNFTGWSLTEHVEAAVRCGETRQAAESLRRLTERTDDTGTAWARGIQARCEALLADGAAADALYRRALALLDSEGIAVQVARTHLLYGEWLRRTDQLAAARDQLRTAHRMFEEMHLAAFGERARRELAATGERARSRRPAATARLTTQEAQIAALAASGLTNPQIGAELFLSPHTVEWHLRKVYAKLGISSRRTLPDALAAAEAT
ncbi:helix-turn-helix transcriptional regulator [Jiangella anatolica]|uniref:LuxR family transcriptional regulator n=1 Tax=Jiangella anatolica TaxID=2670374 RepID=A0A2W2C0K2_9ACTN|nr:LuxR family transcriptional regulator [Jiangella anatolica]PZF86254.1 LuxR family transcriptional regulator [Jiangella anatolica]